MLSPRLRWKLNRARDRLLGAWERIFRRPPRPRVCFSCGRLVGASETKCSHCGASQQALSLSVFKRIALAVIPAEYPVTYALLFANLLFFAVAWIVTLNRTGGTDLFAHMDNEVMLMLGAKSAPYIARFNQYWRLVMANFLHWDLLHFGFNSFVLWQVGPQVEELFGSRRYLFLYLLTGILGFTASFYWYGLYSPPSAGASASLFGLIGILISYISQRRGFTSEYRASLIRWAIFIIVIGFVLPFDNAAHIGGLVSGLALGRLVDVRRPVSAAARFRVEAMAWGSLVVILWSVAMVLINLPAGPS
jgi:rhomboid protease GluP